MIYQLELRHFRYFLAVAEDLHFRKAAERLFISQPGLSRQIHQMEELMGIKLFDRHSRKVALTAAGRYLYEHVKEFMQMLDQGLDQAKLIDQGLKGKLQLGYVGSAMQEVIPNLMVRFQKAYPEVLFGLQEMDNQEQISQLQAQRIDIGFVRMERVPRGIGIKTLLSEPFCLVVPAGHGQMNTGTDLTLFREEPFILFDQTYSPSYFEKVMQIFDDAGFSPRVTHRTVHAGSIYKLVEHGFGVSIVPRSLATKQPRIKFIELSQLRQRTVLSAVWNTESRNPILPHVLALLETQL